MNDFDAIFEGTLQIFLDRAAACKNVSFSVVRENFRQLTVLHAKKGTLRKSKNLSICLECSMLHTLDEDYCESCIAWFERRYFYKFGNILVLNGTAYCIGEGTDFWLYKRIGQDVQIATSISVLGDVPINFIEFFPENCECLTKI